jgi:hypothetical protein
METKAPVQQVNGILLLGGISTAMVIIVLLFSFLFQGEVRTIKLLRNEYAILEQQKRIITASSEIGNEYSNEIEIISHIFPNEQSIPVFIQTLENLIRQSSEEYTFKFNSLTPIVEGDKLFLLMTVTMRTDLPKLLLFFFSLEKLPYMTHCTGVIAKTPNGFIGKSEVSIGMKVYVQNPFTIIK